MHSASHLMNRPVLEIATGREIGKANGVLIDAATGRIAALRVKRGILQSEVFVRWQDLQGVGKDALTVRSEDALLQRGEVDADTAYLDELHGLSVFTEGGERLGEVADYRIDSDGTLTGFDVLPADAPRSLFGNSDKGRFFVPSQQVTTIGAESVVVDNAVQELIHGPGHEIHLQG